MSVSLAEMESIWLRVSSYSLIQACMARAFARVFPPLMILAAASVAGLVCPRVAILFSSF